MLDLIIKATLETLVMTFTSWIIGILLGGILAIILFNSSKYGMRESKYLYYSLEFTINALRSVPYIILTVLLIPISRMIVGSSIGTYSAIIPLAFSATLLTTKMVEESLKTVPKALVEAGISMGASQRQIILKILISEAGPNIISGLTVICINLIGFSAMGGAVGGGGLGDLAIRYGYQRYNLEVLFSVIVILIVLVQIIQVTGNILAAKIKK